MFKLFCEDNFHDYVESIFSEIDDYYSKNINQNFFNKDKDDICRVLVNKYSISFLEVDEEIKLISKDKFYFDTNIWLCPIWY